MTETSREVAKFKAVSPYPLENAIGTEPWQARVTKEKRELDQKLTDLCAFLDSEAAGDLTTVPRVLMGMQRHAMRTYSDVLQARIANFTHQPRDVGDF